jgi:anti-sigma regulatory factor (Ser/Thr protein kinase)
MLTERWAFRAIPQAAAEARRATRQLAERTGADPSVLPALALCVTEAVANVVTHAYRNEREPGEVELEARRPTGELCVFVRDRGCGMRPRNDSPGAGFGLGLISTLASRVSIRPLSPSGTELLMRFDVGERAARRSH